MSFLALAAAADMEDPTSLSNAERLVLFGLAHHHNRRSGSCYPSQLTIAGRMNVAERSVLSALRSLEEKGLIVVLKGRGAWSGGRRSDAYRLLFAEAYAKAHPAVAAMTAKAEEPAMAAGGEGQDFPAKSADFPAMAAGEPGKNLESKNTPNPSRGKRRPKEPPSAEIMQAAERIKKLTPGRAGKRSTAPEIAAALVKAAKEGETDLRLIELGLEAYYGDQRNRREDWLYASGAVVMINGAKWREWLLDDQEAQPRASTSAAAGVAALDQEAFLAFVWRTRLEDFKRIGAWDRSNYGQRPDEVPRAGERPCQCPPAILAEFGFGAAS